MASPSAFSGPYGRVQQVTRPLKGSFPLDYEKACHLEMLNYLCCLHEQKNQNSECRERAFEYFKCRIDNGLMDRDEWSKLGFKEFAERKSDD